MPLHEAAFQVTPDKGIRTEEGTVLRIPSAGDSIRSALPGDRQSVDGRMDRTRNEPSCSSGLLSYIQHITGRDSQSQGRMVCLARSMDISTCAMISPPLLRRISLRVTKGERTTWFPVKLMLLGQFRTSNDRCYTVDFLFQHQLDAASNPYS